MQAVEQMTVYPKHGSTDDNKEEVMTREKGEQIFNRDIEKVRERERQKWSGLHNTSDVYKTVRQEKLPERYPVDADHHFLPVACGRSVPERRSNRA